MSVVASGFSRTRSSSGRERDGAASIAVSRSSSQALEEIASSRCADGPDIIATRASDITHATREFVGKWRPSASERNRWRPGGKRQPLRVSWPFI